MTGPVRDVFTASNGYEVRPLYGGVVIYDRDGDPTLGEETDYHLDEHDLTALRELFQHERDTQLGRWRWPENPEYVVYPDKLNSDLVVVLAEDAPDSARGFSRRHHLSSVSDDFVRAAAAYFDAHPVRRPWEDAKDGEIWALRTATDPVDAEVPQYLCDGERYFPVPLRTPSDPSWRPAGFASDFYDGRRVWPEVSE